MKYRFYKTAENTGRLGTFYKTDGEQIWTLDNVLKEWEWIPPAIFKLIGEQAYFQKSEPITDAEMFIEIL